MNHSSHIFMHQAYQLEISSAWERDRVCVGAGEWRGGYAHRVIKAGTAGRNSRTSHLEGRAWLCRSEESHSMDFISVKGPCDAVTSVDPNFIGKKGQRLPSFVMALCSYRGLPCFGMALGWKHHNGQEEGAAEREWRLKWSEFFQLIPP